MRRLVRRIAVAGLIAVALAVLWPFAAPAAQAHGFTSVVYARISAPAAGRVETRLELEYDLLVVSAADAEHDDRLFREGSDAFENGTSAERAAVLEAHAPSVVQYVSDRYGVASDGRPCAAGRTGRFGMTQRQGVPYAVLTLDHRCAGAGNGHVVTSTLFPDSEEYVTGTKTILTYDLDERTGSAALDADQRSFSTEQTTAERFWEFFRLGAEHLLTGVDHILFLLALIAGSRRLREVVLAATTFTVAHSITFILAATHLVSVPSLLVEPTIALSITVVAAWHLWRIGSRRAAAGTLERTSGPLGLDRAGRLRLAVVFAFGLVHGLGFASALGIEQAWSWTLLWSLLVFNVGIESVQLGIIAIVFPLLALLRRRSPRLALLVTGIIAAVVSVAGLVWFVERVFGL
jgi:hypothetical protein